ncbi:MAG: hypothetical protein ACTHNQ_04585 [Microbacterium sp.]|uniref:hypothetical protein n=1 Tax=Microbacterium sp. TaxID=51671 RepID=UPI003F7F33B7
MDVGDAPGARPGDGRELVRQDRFPADAPHLFEAITPQATLFVCTTIPQLSMDGRGNTF